MVVGAPYRPPTTQGDTWPWFSHLPLAARLHSHCCGAGNTTDATQVWTGGRDMDSDYMFLCGVMWCRFGQQDAGKELLRAADVADPDMRALAAAMFSKGLRRLREVEKRTQPSSGTILERELCG